MFSPKKLQTTHTCIRVKNPTSNRNPLIMKTWIFYLLIAGFFFLVCVPAIIMMLYSIGDKGTIYIKTKLDVGDALGFYGTLLSAAGSITLGCVAIWQTQKANKMTETALSLQKSEQISALVPKSCTLRFFDSPAVLKTGEMGAQVSLIQENQTPNLIIDFQMVYPEIFVCNHKKKFLICDREDKQSAFAKVGIAFSIDHNVVNSSCKSEVNFFIPTINITDKSKSDFLDIAMKYNLCCTNIYGYQTHIKVMLNTRLVFDSEENLFRGENIVINYYTVEALIPPK